MGEVDLNRIKNTYTEISIGRSKNLTNKRFGRLEVLYRTKNNIHRKAMWVCLCNCGNFHVVVGHALYNGKSNSCGCLLSETTSRRRKDSKLTDCQSID